jgi:hypothetical protein
VLDNSHCRPAVARANEVRRCLQGVHEVVCDSLRTCVRLSIQLPTFFFFCREIFTHTFTLAYARATRYLHHGDEPNGTDPSTVEVLVGPHNDAQPLSVVGTWPHHVSSHASELVSNHVPNLADLPRFENSVVVVSNALFRCCASCE